MRSDRANPLPATENSPLEGAPTFALSHRLFRLVWAIVWLLAVRWTPPPFRGWRRFWLQLFGARLHPTSDVRSSVRVWYPPHLEMGPYSSMGPRVNCYNMAPIRLGPYAIVSQDAELVAGTHDIDDRAHQLQTFPIVLGERVWVAAGAFVGPGVTLGDRSVLGARSVCFKDTEADGVYVGNPAKKIKVRILPE